jgi:hypothetical protein
MVLIPDIRMFRLHDRNWRMGPQTIISIHKCMESCYSDQRTNGPSILYYIVCRQTTNQGSYSICSHLDQLCQSSQSSVFICHELFMQSMVTKRLRGPMVVSILPNGDGEMFMALTIIHRFIGPRLLGNCLENFLSFNFLKNT